SPATLPSLPAPIPTSNPVSNAARKTLRQGFRASESFLLSSGVNVDMSTTVNTRANVVSTTTDVVDSARVGKSADSKDFQLAGIGIAERFAYRSPKVTY